MAFASGSTPNPGHCETVFDGIFRSLKEWASGKKRHKPSGEKDFSPDVLHLISKLDEAVQLCQKNRHARQKLRRKSEQIHSVIMKLERIIADPNVTKHKETSGKKRASSGHQKSSQSLKDEQQIQLDQCDQKCQQVDDVQMPVPCEPEDRIDLSKLVIAEESTAAFARNGTIGDSEHEHELDSGLVDVCLESEEGADDISHLKKTISALRSQIIDLNNNIDTLRGHSREQSREVLKFKQEAEVSEMKGQQLVEMERMQHEAKEECVYLHKQLEITTEELRQVRNEKQVVEKEYAQLERTLISMGSLSSQLMQARQTDSKLRQRLTEKENENAAIRSQLEMRKGNSERSQCETTEFEKSTTQIQDRIELERLAQRDQYEQLKHDYELTNTQLMELRESVAVVEEENKILKQEILAKSSQVKQYAKEVDRLKKHIESTSTEHFAVPTAVSPSVMKCDKSTQDDLNQRSVSPFTGQKHAQVVPDGDHLLGESVECDGPSPQKKKSSDSSPCGDQPHSNPDVKDELSKPSPCQLEDSITQLENPLLKKLDDEIHEEASEVIQEVNGGRFEDSLERRRPYDPNLVCPMCRKRFRIGGIQKFRRHVNTCTGTDD